jgi:hypothetical protein
MALPIWMPLRNEHAAPTFDTSRPRELPRYFENLEQLMDRAQITDESEKKKQSVYYVNFDTEQQWKAIPEFEDPNISYQDFKKAIMEYYPEASDGFRYSLQDLELLIGKHQHLGISSVNDLADYHLHFTAITSWLIEKQQLGDLEQRRAYIQAFRPQLLSVIINRLRLEKPDHHPNIPYRVTEVFVATRFILQGIPSSDFTSTATSIPKSPNPTDNVLKIDSLIPFLANVTKSVVKALHVRATADVDR